MGLIFDIHSARRYEAWCNSPKGRELDRFIRENTPLLLDPQPGERVLDIGCGSGNHLLFLNELGLDIHGMDASPYMLSKARERLGNCCTLKIGMAEDLPYDDNEFDLSVLINTLEFLDDPIQALKEACRVTKRKIFIGVMNSLSWYRLVNRVEGSFRDSFMDHIRCYNLWELKSYVRMVFGQVPVDWRSIQILPSIFCKITGLLSASSGQHHCPFGPYLGLSLAIAYTVRTDNLPLKVRVPKTGQPIAGSITPVGNLKQHGFPSNHKIGIRS
jgi:ubiquinone/menaquinone biosynthesis C-methylase UbiE